MQHTKSQRLTLPFVVYSHRTGTVHQAYVQEDTKRGGFVAFPVATPGPQFAPGPGRLRSPDGLNW